MSKFKELIASILYMLIPPIHMWRKNRVVIKSIIELENQYGDDDIPDNIKNENAKIIVTDYKRALIIKDKLEDKAKSNVIAVTISITLIMGASAIITNTIKNQTISWFPALTVSLFILSVIFMITAGIFALRLLMDKNKVFFVTADEDDVEKSYEARIECYKSTKLNDKVNHIRNNYVFTSFACIRNALVCLFIVMVLVLSPTFLPQPNIGSVPINMQNGHVFYSVQAATYLDANGVVGIVDEIDALIWKHFNEGKININQTVGLIDANHNIFIKVKIISDVEAIVLQVESYIVP